MSDHSQDASSSPSVEKVRLWPVAIVLLAGFAAWSVVSAEFSFSGTPLRDMLFIIALMDFASYVSIRLSRLSGNKQVLLLSTFAVVHVCLFFMLRIDGLFGNGRPMIVWSWTPTNKERFDEQLPTQHRPESDVSVNLNTTTERDFPSFRGKDRSGIVRGVQLSRDWNNQPPRQLWRRSVGAGWSSFAVVGNYCVTQEQRGDHEAVVCYELLTGKPCWVHLDRARFYEFTSREGPRATPTIADGLVYSLGATGILNCLDGSSGKPLWSVNILRDNETENCLFGTTASPLVVEDMVVVSPGGTGRSLAAYDKISGKRVWRAGDADASYSSPQLATIAGRRQILSFNGDGLFSHDVETGAVLWSVPWVSNPSEKNNVCQPIVIPAVKSGEVDCVFISSSYGMGCALFEIHRIGDDFSIVQRWSNRNLKAKFTSVVLRDGHIYGLDESILVCLDVTTGQRKWKRGRYGHGQLILVDDLLLIQSEGGEIAMVEASPRAFHELARFPALSDRTWNHPVVSGEYLLVRNSVEAACFQLPTKEVESRDQ